MSASGMASRKASENTADNELLSSKRMVSQASEDIPDRSMTPYYTSQSPKNSARSPLQQKYVKAEDVVHEIEGMEDESEISSHKSNQNKQEKEVDWGKPEEMKEKEVEVESMEDDEQHKAMQQYLGDMSIAGYPNNLEMQSIEELMKQREE